MFYISAYLEHHRDEYNERLLALSRDRDWDGWVAFFLNALVEQAADNTQKAKAILDLYDELKISVPEVTRSPYAIQAIDAMFSRPIFKRTDFIAESHIPRQSAHRILQNLQKNGILTEIQEGRGKRAAIYSFPRLLDITEGTIS